MLLVMAVVFKCGNTTLTPSRTFLIQKTWQCRRGFPLRGDKRNLPASRGVFFPGQERCWPGDVTVRLQCLLQAGAIQAGIGKNPGKSLNKLNTANEMTDQKAGERGGLQLLFQSSVNRAPAALMANKGRDALPVQERHVVTLIPPPSPVEKRLCHLHGAAHLLGIPQREDAGSSSGPL